MRSGGTYRLRTENTWQEQEEKKCHRASCPILYRQDDLLLHRWEEVEDKEEEGEEEEEEEELREREKEEEEEEGLSRVVGALLGDVGTSCVFHPVLHHLELH